MQTIELQTTGRFTSRLGYGCSSLMGSLGRRASLKLLEVAFDSGIRHFDVAPSYGQGEAEGCLGDFLCRHRSNVTVATKFGLAASGQSTLTRYARRLAAPMLCNWSAVKQRLAPAAMDRFAGTKMRFDGASAKQSLDASLRKLRSEHINLFLLHEPEASDLHDDTLLRFLEDAVAAGKIATFGVGSAAAKISELRVARPPYCSVLQYEWSLFDATIASSSAFRLHHRSLSTQFRALHENITWDRDLCRDWSQRIGRDLMQDGMLASLMLKASLELNPASIILFSSKSAANIRDNVRTHEDQSMVESALRLRDVVRASSRQMAA